MTHTLDGDGKDVWPWLGDTAEEAKKDSTRFDVARLDRWRDLFEYIQARGIVIHLVLEDDSAWTGFDYPAYYREIVARFGYLPALQFNYCEEFNERHTLAEALDHMKLLAEIDPYNHPRAIHNVNAPRAEYVRSPFVNVASIQTPPLSPASLNARAIEWLEAPLALKQRPLVIGFDEGRPAEDRRSWWSVYLGGGMWESYIPVPEGYAAIEPAWRELSLARTFMTGLPFETMIPANHLVAAGEAFCLARPGEVYAIYLPSGGTLQVDLTAGNRYKVDWFDPRGEGASPWRDAPSIQGGTQSLAAPDSRDWAVRITRTEGSAKASPVARSAKLFSRLNEPAPVFLAALPERSGGELRYEIVNTPRHGTLSGEGPNRVYTPRRGFTGQDEFTWRAISPEGATNLGRVTITCSASGRNQPPVAENQVLKVRRDTPATMILRYTDIDGPGPYVIRTRTQPRHGKLTGLDNDVTYTPESGFTGADFFEWQVVDGESRSNRARVDIVVE